MELILNDICKIISDLFNISLDKVSANMEKSLFGEPFHLRPTELLYLYFYLEQKYDICFNEKDVLDFSFISIQSITNILNSYINI